MRRETQNVLLVLVGGVLIKIVLDGSYRRYVAPWVGWLVIAAGVVMVALALVAIARDLRGGREGGGPHGDACADGEDSPGHGTRSAWLLLAPVLAILLIAPPALDSGALVDGRNRGLSATGGTSSAPEPLPPGDAPELALVDFVSRAAAEPGDPSAGSLGSRDVTLTGFLAPARDGRGTDLVRWVIACCAADASAVRVHLGGVPAGSPPTVGEDDHWVRVRGRWEPGTGTEADGFVPTLTVVESLRIRVPDPVYEY